MGQGRGWGRDRRGLGPCGLMSISLYPSVKLEERPAVSVLNVTVPGFYRMLRGVSCQSDCHGKGRNHRNDWESSRQAFLEANRKGQRPEPAATDVGLVPEPTGWLRFAAPFGSVPALALLALVAQGGCAP